MVATKPKRFQARWPKNCLRPDELALSGRDLDVARTLTGNLVAPSKHDYNPSEGVSQDQAALTNPGHSLSGTKVALSY